MNETQQTSTPSDQAVAHARCACGELTEAISVKALREVIDARIDHLSGRAQKGTKVAVPTSMYGIGS